MLVRHQDINKNFETYYKSDARYIFVGFADIVDEPIIKETKKFLYFASGYKLRKKEEL